MRYILNSFWIILIGFMLIASSCNTNKNYSDAIPELLPRKKGHQQSEFNQIQSRYQGYIQTLSKNPKDHATLVKLIELFIAESRMSGNQTYYNKASLQLIHALLKESKLRDDIKYQTLSYQSTILLSLHRFQEAKEVALKALRMNASESDIYGALVDAEVELGNYSNAITYCDKMISIRPDIRSYSRVSYLRQIMGDLDGAKVAMRMAVEAGAQGQENTEWARVELGNLYLHCGQTDTATMLFESSLFARTDYAPAEIGLAKKLEVEKDYTKAIAHAKNAIRLHSESSYILFLAKLYRKIGDETNATNTEKKVLTLLLSDESENTTSNSAWHNGKREIAQTYLALKNYDKAYEYALQDYQLRPKNIDANALMAEITFYQHDFSKAENYIQQALVTGTQQATWYLLASQIYEAQKQTDKALEMKAKALRCNPKASEALFARK